MSIDRQAGLDSGQLQTPHRIFGQFFQRLLAGGAAFHVLLGLVELGVIEAVVHEPLEQISVRTVFHFHSRPPGPWGTAGAGRASDAGS
jgi:hypothetical protein